MRGGGGGGALKCSHFARRWEVSGQITKQPPACSPDPKTCYFSGHMEAAQASCKHNTYISSYWTLHHVHSHPNFIRPLPGDEQVGYSDVYMSCLICWGTSCDGWWLKALGQFLHRPCWENLLQWIQFVRTGCRPALQKRINIFSLFVNGVYRSTMLNDTSWFICNVSCVVISQSFLFSEEHLNVFVLRGLYQQTPRQWLIQIGSVWAVTICALKTSVFKWHKGLSAAHHLLWVYYETSSMNTTLLIPDWKSLILCKTNSYKLGAALCLNLFPIFHKHKILNFI